MNQHGVDVAERAARLRHTMLFGGLAPGTLRALAQSADVATFDPGAIVVRQGELGDALYVVTRGLLRVRRRTPEGEEVLGEIHKGGFFGEFALLEARPRNATVEAVSSTALLRLTRGALHQQLVVHPELEDRLRSVLELRRSAGRAPFPPPIEAQREAIAGMLGVDAPGALDALAAELEWLWLPAGEVLLREEEPGDAVFFVLEGRLRVFTGSGGVASDLGLVGPGESVGEMALLSGAPRSASVRALLDTQLLRLSRGAFDDVLAKNPTTLAFFRDLMLRRISQGAATAVLSRASYARPPMTLEDCEDVMGTKDPVLRNFKITHSYHRLSLDLADVLGPQDVNWPAFGAHASKSAGYSIRKEEVPLFGVFEALSRSERLGRGLRRAGERLAGSRLVRDIDQLLERVSEAVSDGNLRIFGDMAPVIVRYVEMLRTGAARDPAAMAAFCATLKPGASEQDGQDLLGMALTAWYEASREPDPKRRSELMLLGNARMGLHEQIRIQPDIEQALGAPLRNRIGDELGRSMEGFGRALPLGLGRGFGTGVGVLERRALDFVAAALRRVITRRMMRLRLPRQDVWLGADVPTSPGGSVYPPELRELAHPALREMVARFVRNADSTEGSGAVDWVSLDDRMNYIIHLFRSRQKNHDLYTPPLDPGQLAAIAPAAESAGQGPHAKPSGPAAAWSSAPRVGAVQRGSSAPGQGAVAAEESTPLGFITPLPHAGDGDGPRGRRPSAEDQESSRHVR